MSVSIKDRTLAIAKKKEAARLKLIEDKFIEFMNEKFNKSMKGLDSWGATNGVGYTYFLNEVGDGDINSEDLKKVAEGLGFLVTILRDAKFLISIPTPQQKKTKAQLMLYRFNAELKKTRNEHEKIGRESAAQVLQALIEGNFEVKKEENPYTGVYYKATVKSQYSLTTQSKYFEWAAKKYMEKKGFSKIEIYSDRNSWIVYIPINKS